MEKQHILDEIKRTAEANRGEALGVARFFQETGIKPADWHGRFWARWGDAVREAGFERSESAAAKSHVLVAPRNSFVLFW